jgi:hypothetical protein
VCCPVSLDLRQGGWPDLGCFKLGGTVVGAGVPDYLRQVPVVPVGPSCPAGDKLRQHAVLPQFKRDNRPDASDKAGLPQVKRDGTAGGWLSLEVCACANLPMCLSDFCTICRPWS